MGSRDSLYLCSELNISLQFIGNTILLLTIQTKFVYIMEYLPALQHMVGVGPYQAIQENFCLKTIHFQDQL